MLLRINLMVCLGIWLMLQGLVSCGHNYQTHIVKHTKTTDPHKDGFWTRKTTWKSRWVKYWQTKTIYVPVWKKVWSPVVQNEWVPLPNAPINGWSKSDSQDSVQEVDY